MKCNKIASVDNLRAQILTKAGLDFINNNKTYESMYNWKPYNDILQPNNKMKYIDQVPNHHYLNDIPSVLLPFLKDFNLKRMHDYRLHRIRESLRNNNCDAGLFFDPTNIRYITDVPNMQVWIKGNPYRYVLISADERDPILLYDCKAAEHLGLTLRPDIIQTVHKSKVPVYFSHFDRQQQSLNAFVADLLEQIDTNFVELKNKQDKTKINIAVDGHRSDVIMALMNESRFNIMDGFKCAEEARIIKNNDENLCIKLSCEVANIASYRMKEFLNENMSRNKSITDNEIFAILSGTNIEYGGEYLECKLLGSGQRSNPWYQESSNNAIEYETLLSFDTDMIGPFGYCADFSRCFYTGHRNSDSPKDKKFYTYCKDLYNIAFEQVQYNMSIVKPGISYKELQEKLWKCPRKYYDQRYTCVIHGVGSCDEYPCIMEKSDRNISSDNVIKPGMCLSVESYIGEVNGKVGVKLEDQIFVNENDIEVVSTFPYEKELLI